MTDIGQLTKIISDLDLERVELTKTIKALETKEANLNLEKKTLLQTIVNNTMSLKRENSKIANLDITISEVKLGYNKIMESTKMLLDIVSSKCDPPAVVHEKTSHSGYDNHAGTYYEGDTLDAERVAMDDVASNDDDDDDADSDGA